MKNSGSCHISAQNIDCRYLLEPPRRGGSNEYPQSMFMSRNKKINVHPSKPQFYCIIVEFKGVKTIWACFHDGHSAEPQYTLSSPMQLLHASSKRNCNSLNRCYNKDGEQQLGFPKKKPC